MTATTEMSKMRISKLPETKRGGFGMIGTARICCKILLCINNFITTEENKMKKIISLLLAVVMVCGLCAVAAAADDVTEVTLKVWAPQEDQANADSWLQQMEAKFEVIPSTR